MAKERLKSRARRGGVAGRGGSVLQGSGEAGRGKREEAKIIVGEVNAKVFWKGRSAMEGTGGFAGGNFGAEESRGDVGADQTRPNRHGVLAHGDKGPKVRNEILIQAMMNQGLDQ